MTISYPRDMLCGVLQSNFQIGRPIAINRLNGGVTQVRELGEPRWFASYTYAGSKRTQFQAVQAWVDSLRGGLQPFYGHDALKPYPTIYRAAIPGWPGTASVSGLGTNGFSISGGAANLQLKAGDMVGLVEGTKRGLFRIVEDVTLSGVGAGTLAVEPRIVAGQFTSPTANFYRPVCTMVLDPTSVSATQTAWGPSSVSFGGVQQVY